MTSNVYAPPKSNVETATKECEECGELINKKAVICPKCGVAQKQAVNKTVLLLLTFFLGGLGGHKFYLKKPWWGVLYLLFFWTYIPGLVALIEFIIFACTSEERLNEKYEAAGGASVGVILVVGFVGVIAVIGILAAIALPQYQNYTMRARTTQAVQAAEPMRVEVEQFIVKNGRVPEVADIQNNTITVPNIATVQLEAQGVVGIHFMLNTGPLAGQTIDIVPTIADGRLSWNCGGGTVPPRSRPRQCQK